MVAGADVLAKAVSQLGVTEDPPNSNNVPYWNAWRGNYGSWCAAFVSWCYTEAGAPLPPIESANGFKFVPYGVTYAIRHGETTDKPQPGDVALFSWSPPTWEGGYPWVMENGRWVQAGDHTGIVEADNGDGTVTCIEGNTSLNGSQDNGGAVLRRTRDKGLVVAFWHPATLGRPLPTNVLLEDDVARLFTDPNGTTWSTDGVSAIPLTSSYPFIRSLGLVPPTPEFGPTVTWADCGNLLAYDERTDSMRPIHKLIDPAAVPPPSAAGSSNAAEVAREVMAAIKAAL